MSAHFLYQHLPAQNLGHADPYRPYVSGGLGAAISIWRLLMHVFSRENRTAVSSVESAEPISTE